MTEYGWPTWADIVGHTLHLEGYEYYNFASAGSGNYYILASMIKANHDFQFTDTDIIMVMWSSWSREDRYLPGKFSAAWTNQGNVLNGDIYDPQFIQRYWSLEHDIIKSITSISAARAMFNISWEGSINVYESTGSELPGRHDPLLDAVTQIRLHNTFPTVDIDTVVPGSPRYHRLQLDGHPSPAEHLQFVKEYITPQMGIDIHPDTVTMVMEFDKLICRAFSRMKTHADHMKHIEYSTKEWRKNVAPSFRKDIYQLLWHYSTANENSDYLIDYLNSWANKPK
jgi:hypothetical protein